MFEPFFDLYLKQIKLTGAKAKFVALGGSSATSKDPWALDINKLKDTITDKTRILILNSPHNPTGKVFTLSELEAIAQIVRDNPNIIVLSDEVYKFTVYNPKEEGDLTSKGHYHFARLPDMWDRTITLSSCGKTFSITGWQVGWTVGPSKYIKPIQELLPCVQFCASTPIQHALMCALQIAEKPYEGHSNYYEWMRSQFQSKRMILQEGLEAAGIETVESEGGFFLMGKLPIRPDVLKSAQNSAEPYDWHFCRMLANDYGVVAIPASPFFSSKEAADRMGPMARFAFCKRDETLIKANKALKAGALKYKETLIIKAML
jgi:kynurenine--oxoglutarate transaminase/cysteine-S-conjugate beta-lyase/glutamine--phenylpyruvate transaminase